jgi:hypothetical protein
MSAMHDLIARWCSEAATVERCGHESTGKLLRRLAIEVDEALRDDQDETLTLAEAALESSYSTEHLRKRVAAETIPNAGEQGRPRIRRGDLPLERVTQPGSPGTPEDDAHAFLNRAKDETERSLLIPQVRPTD